MINLYNNQINARAVIGQSTMVYSASKLMKKSRFFCVFRAFYQPLYNNQINARALIGQSAVGYCAGKPTEKSRVL